MQSNVRNGWYKVGNDGCSSGDICLHSRTQPVSDVVISSGKRIPMFPVSVKVEELQQTPHFTWIGRFKKYRSSIYRDVEQVIGKVLTKRVTRNAVAWCLRHCYKKANNGLSHQTHSWQGAEIPSWSTTGWCWQINKWMTNSFHATKKG